MSDDLPEERYAEVLVMLKAHKNELMRAKHDLEEALQRVEDQEMYVHTIARILQGDKPL